jgi:hypothetical protein
MNMKPAIYAIVCGLLASGPAWAGHSHEGEGHGKKHAKHAGRDDDRDDDHHRGVCYFEQRDVRVITEYYAPRYRNLPPGLAKKYYRTGHLPPGWEKKMEPVPVVVERQLVVLPTEYRRGIIDGQAVVYNPRTQVIVDIVALFGSR